MLCMVLVPSRTGTRVAPATIARGARLALRAEGCSDARVLHWFGSRTRVSVLVEPCEPRERRGATCMDHANWPYLGLRDPISAATHVTALLLALGAAGVLWRKTRGNWRPCTTPCGSRQTRSGGSSWWTTARSTS
jgi:hypothetical protein